MNSDEWKQYQVSFESFSIGHLAAAAIVQPAFRPQTSILGTQIPDRIFVENCGKSSSAFRFGVQL